MQKIEGQKIAAKIIKRLKAQPRPQKILAAVLVGKNPASLNFLKQKEKLAQKLDVNFRLYKFPQNSSANYLRKEIKKIASAKKTGGIIIQLPLPASLNRHFILDAIPQGKDVDVLREQTRLVLPPAVGTVEEIIKNLKLKIKNYRVAVVGLGFLVGQPLARWLMGKVRELYLLDQGSDFSLLKRTDLVVSGVGQPGLIKPAMLKKGAAIIDFGYSIDEKGKISGDFDSSSLKLPIWYTPTPGGTGPILVAKIFENFYKLKVINEQK